MPYLEKIDRIAPEAATVELINCKCMPILLYGLECFSAAKHLRSYISLSRFLMKLLRSTNTMKYILMSLMNVDCSLISCYLAKKLK